MKRQVSGALSADAYPQALAYEALTCVSPLADRNNIAYRLLPTSPIGTSLNPASCNRATAVSDSRASDQQVVPTAVVSEGPYIKAEIKTSLSKTLPSLLQYTNSILIRDESRHNHPPFAVLTCVGCNVHWDNVKIPSTFLSLSSCNHWIHYRCLIWLATREDPTRNQCPVCKTQLFEWDGISALTLATRTNLSMNDKQYIAMNEIQDSVTSYRREYEQECNYIETAINQHFFAQLPKASGFSDGSPDLVQCFNNIMEDFRLKERPQSKWLRWNTTTGSLLFGMLVAIKMRRYLLDGHGKIQQTEAWVAWENGCQSLQKRLLDDVQKI